MHLKAEYSEINVNQGFQGNRNYHIFSRVLMEESFKINHASFVGIFSRYLFSIVIMFHVPRQCGRKQQTNKQSNESTNLEMTQTFVYKNLYVICLILSIKKIIRPCLDF